MGNWETQLNNRYPSEFVGFSGNSSTMFDDTTNRRIGVLELVELGYRRIGLRLATVR